MSSTNRGANRVENDKYNTPALTINSLLDVLRIEPYYTFLEPCRSTGTIYNALHLPTRQKLWAEIDYGIDYLVTPYPHSDLIITNPPFSLALEFLRKSLTEADSVWYLLRLNFLGSQKRKAFWNANPPTHVLVLSERPCFVWVCQNRACKAMYEPGTTTICEACCGKVRAQTDSIEYAWFGWDRIGVCGLTEGVHVL